MRAAVALREGGWDVIELRDIPIPTPAAGQVRVRVHAASINPLDTKLRSGALRPFLRASFPAVFGFDLAGVVESVGPGVTEWTAGDRVYGRTDARYGGTHAEFAIVGAHVLDRTPESLSCEQAASLPLTGMTAIQALRDEAQLQRGQRLLVIGAAGGVGVMAVQMGHAMGAEVTALLRREGAELVERLGATYALKSDRGESGRSRGPYDVVFDTTGQRRWSDVSHLLTHQGVFVTTGFSLGFAVRAAVMRVGRGRQARVIVSRADVELLRALSESVQARHVVPVIDSVWPLEQIVDAYRRLETGHPHGKVVVTIS